MTTEKPRMSHDAMWITRLVVMVAVTAALAAAVAGLAENAYLGARMLFGDDSLPVYGVGWLLLGWAVGMPIVGAVSGTLSPRGDGGRVFAVATLAALVGVTVALLVVDASYEGRRPHVRTLFDGNLTLTVENLFIASCVFMVGYFSIMVVRRALRPGAEGAQSHDLPTDYTGFVCGRCGRSLPPRWKGWKCPTCASLFSAFPPVKPPGPPSASGDPQVIRLP